MRKYFGIMLVAFAVITLAVIPTALGANPKAPKKSGATPQAQCLKLFDDPKAVKDFRAAAAALSFDDFRPDIICLALHSRGAIQPWVVKTCLRDLAEVSPIWNWRQAAKALGVKPSRLCQAVLQYPRGL